MKNMVEELSVEFGKLGLGEHLCCIYRTKKERDAALVSFLIAGLKNNEKCLCVMDECTEEEIVRAFEKAGVEVGGYLESKQLEFLRVEETYLKDGYFDPERALALIKQAEAAAVNGGYRGLRGVVEASWSLRKLPGSERQLEYEAMVNQLLPQSRISAMCLYSERKFSPKVLLDVIWTHPKVVLRGQVCDNPNYIRPRDYLARMKGEVTQTVYEKVKESLIDRMKLERERRLAQEQMRRDQEYLQLIVDRMPIGLIVWDRDFRVRTWNPAATRILGFTREEAVGKHPYDFMVPREVQPRIDEIWRRLLEGDQTAHSINENLTKDGRTIVCEWTNTPLRDAEGNVVGVLSMFQDITERQRAEDALRASEERYRMLVETMNEGLGVLDENGVTVFVNERLCSMLGYSKEEMIGRRAVDFIDGESRKVFEDNFAKMRKGERVVFEVVRVAKDGRRVYTLTSASPILDADGRFRGSFAVVTDITDLKKAEKLLRESELKYSTIVEKSNDGIVVVQDGVIKFANKKLSELTGIPLEDYLGKPYLDFVSPAYRDLVAERYQKRMAGIKVPERYEVELVSKDGSCIPFELSASVIEYEGRPADMGILREISERKRMERELRESEEKYRSLVEHSSDSVYLVDRNLRYLFVNEELLRRLGLPREKVVGRSFGELHTAEETKAFEAKVREVLETGRAVQQEHYSERLGRFFIRTISPVRDPATGEVKAVTVVSKDITELVNIRQRLMVSEQQLRKIIDSSPDLIAVLNPDGSLLDCNQTLLQVGGFSKEEIVGVNFLEFVGPADKERAKKDFKRVLGSQTLRNVEYILRTKDGREFPAEISAVSVTGPADKPMFIVVTARDISERKNAEKKLREMIYAMYDITPGECYLVRSSEMAVRLFVQLLLHGVPGLCLTRERPEKLMKQGVPKETMVILSSVPVKDCESIADLQRVSLRVSEFVREHPGGVVLLGGLEYLISTSGFEAVYRFLQEKRFLFMQSNANLLIPLDLSILSERERALLTSEMKLLI